MNSITPREVEVITLICQGHQNKDVAQMLGMSIKTVEKHRQSVYYKWHVDCVPALIRVALREKVLDLGVFFESRVGENCVHTRPQHLPVESAAPA